MVFLEVIILLFVVTVRGGVLGPTNPPWKPVYNLSMSTLTMQCNGSGWSSPERGAEFGIVVRTDLLVLLSVWVDLIYRMTISKLTHTHTHTRVTTGATQRLSGQCSNRWTVRRDC